MKTGKQARRMAKQLIRLCEVQEVLDENRVRLVVRHAIEAGYRDCPAILTHFVRLVRLARAQHTARVESAIPLPPDMRDATQTSLTCLYGPELATTFVQRPSLIGGLRIQIGSDVYDGSVLARLNALKSSF
jgi:F-type H+-transporting ATPase subunit delta